MSKPKRRNKKNKIIDITPTELHLKKKQYVEIIPRNLNQEEYYEYLNDSTKRVIFALGPAGTGKTFLATLHAIQMLKTGQIEKIIISRPAVGVSGEEHGFLPGDLTKKMAPWTRPLFDIFEEYYSLKDINTMIEEGIIEIAPLAYLRGRTFKNSVIILDESQNTTPEQMKMALTRIGENSRMFITGDPRQTDLNRISGLIDFTNKLKDKEVHSIVSCEFTIQDVERDQVVADVLNIYDED